MIVGSRLVTVDSTAWSNMPLNNWKQCCSILSRHHLHIAKGWSGHLMSCSFVRCVCCVHLGVCLGWSVGNFLSPLSTP